MTCFKEVFKNITKDERYLRNLGWGKPRKGHPEGTVEAHIAELEENLAKLNLNTSSEEYWKLRVLIHVHDSFKAEATPKVAIPDPRSHASIAASFLSDYCKDQDLLTMVQYHDEPYALWRQVRSKGTCSQDRLQSLTSRIDDWHSFLRFNAIDGVTDGKSIEPLEWAARTIGSEVGLEREAREAIKCLSVWKDV